MKYIVENEYNDVRLDRYLRNNFKDLALGDIFKAIRTGKIKVNGKKSKQNYRLQTGDEIGVFLDTQITQKSFEKIKLNDKEIRELENSIIYQDENILIYNKKPNQVMHRGSGHDFGLVEILKSYLGNSDFNFVNRIDKLTSGLIIGAKNLITTRELTELIRNREIIKKYYILVEGVIHEKNFTVKSYLKKLDDKVVEDPTGKLCESHFTNIKSFNGMTLLIGELKTGRTHQLRVQLANMGHSIVGDPKYGHKSKIYKNMCLMSYYIEIPKYGITIDVPYDFN